MSLRLHEVEGVNRTKTVRFYPFVLTSEERDEETGYGYCNEYQPHAVKRMFDYKNEMLYDMRWDEAGNLGQVSMGKPGEMFERGRFLFWTEDCCGCEHRLCQSNVVSNRMHAAVDDKYFSYYVYDHSGGSCASREQSQACLSYAEMEQRRRSQRRLKLTGINKQQDVCQRLRTPQNKLNEVSNADLMATYTVLNEPTLYPSAYMVLSNKGYTKHYYAGTDLCASREQSQACLSYAETKQSVRSNRVAARLGGGGLNALQPVIASDEDLQWRADKLFKQSLDHVNHRVLGENDLNCIMRNKFSPEVLGEWIDGIPYHVRADVETEYWQFKEMVNSMLDDRNQGHEKEVFFYHSDHLGSANWITDGGGMAVQHIQYLPYGEPYINQRPFGYSERFTFTGEDPRKGWRIPLNEIKYNEQRDALRLNPQSGGLCGARLTSPQDLLTGYGYFGARYYWSEVLTGWLSVDPMADKYPFISPYAYCNWNPVKLVDPDGREVINRHTKNIENLKKKIADLEGQIKDCNGSNLKKLNRLLADKKKSLKKEMEYEKIVDNAIQDLKNYGGDEFEKLDQLTDINGNKVDVYIQMVDYIDKIGGPEGKTYGKVRANGPCSSEMGENTMLISLSHKYRDVAGKVLAHEGGHVLFDVKHPTFAPAFYKEHPTDKKTGHEPGNTSGLVAKEYERRYVENYNKSRR